MAFGPPLFGGEDSLESRFFEKNNVMTATQDTVEGSLHKNMVAVTKLAQDSVKKAALGPSSATSDIAVEDSSGSSPPPSCCPYNYGIDI